MTQRPQVGSFPGVPQGGRPARRRGRGGVEAAAKIRLLSETRARRRLAQSSTGDGRRPGIGLRGVAWTVAYLSTTRAVLVFSANATARRTVVTRLSCRWRAGERGQRPTSAISTRRPSSPGAALAVAIGSEGVAPVLSRCPRPHRGPACPAWRPRRPCRQVCERCLRPPRVPRRAPVLGPLCRPCRRGCSARRGSAEARRAGCSRSA
jgi:hypothetical protein